MAPDGIRRRELLAVARLYLVTDLKPARALGDVLAEGLAGGVRIVQLRDKAATDAELIDAARTLLPAVHAADALLVVNDRPDVAVAAGADGVHLGQDDEAPGEVRKRIGDEPLIGLSTHDPGQIRAALDDDTIDYLGVGPVYATATKPHLEPVGLELVGAAARQASPKPWFAIGGIDVARGAEVVAAGAERIAVVRAIRDAADPAAAAVELLAALGEVARVA